MGRSPRSDKRTFRKGNHSVSAPNQALTVVIRQRPLLALSGHWFVRRVCPLLGVKQTSLVRDRVSVNDPRVDLELRCKRSSAGFRLPAQPPSRSFFGSRPGLTKAYRRSPELRDQLAVFLSDLKTRERVSAAERPLFPSLSLLGISGFTLAVQAINSRLQTAAGVSFLSLSADLRCPTDAGSHAGNRNSKPLRGAIAKSRLDLSPASSVSTTQTLSPQASSTLACLTSSSSQRRPRGGGPVPAAGSDDKEKPRRVRPGRADYPDYRRAVIM